MTNNNIARLQPNKDMKYPNAIDPIKHPIFDVDAIHETCSLVNGPDCSGVSAEINFGSAGAVQPRLVPSASVIKFAAQENQWRTGPHLTNDVIFHVVFK